MNVNEIAAKIEDLNGSIQMKQLIKQHPQEFPGMSCNGIPDQTLCDIVEILRDINEILATHEKMRRQLGP